MAEIFTPRPEIAALVANVKKAAAGFEAAAEGDVHVARRNLQLEVRKLLYSLEEPNAEVWPRVFQVSWPSKAES
jgi:hypothetical protein